MSEFPTSAPVESLPQVNPAEKLIPNGRIQTLEVSAPKTRLGGETFVDLRGLSPLQSKESGFTANGIAGDLLTIIQFGDQKVGIVDTAKEKGYDGEYYMDPERFLVTNMIEATTVEGHERFTAGASAFLREPDTLMKVGRDRMASPLQHIGVNPENDTFISGNHARIGLDEQGMLHVKDVKSRNGTEILVRPTNDPDRTLNPNEAAELYEMVHQKNQVAEGAGIIATKGLEVEMLATADTPQLIDHVPLSFGTGEPVLGPRYEEAKPFAMDMQAAKEVNDDELVRDKGNGGKEIDQTYRENQTNARRYLAENFTTMYGSTEAFKSVLSEAHRLAAANNVYGQVGKGTIGLQAEKYGEIRHEAGDFVSKRSPIARNVAKIAERYGDPYADRFAPGTPDGNSQSRVLLEGIDFAYLPQDTIFYDENGSIDKHEDGTEAYEFYYPDGRGVDAYMGKIAELGTEIAAEMSKANPDKKKAMDLIARQYQYGANARPFNQINNSLFMNLANMQIKLLGLSGVTHGIMDHVAQRIQPAAFSVYFANRVAGTEA